MTAIPSTKPLALVYVQAAAWAVLLGALIVDGELYYRVVAEFLRIAPAGFVLGNNNLNEDASSFNLAITSLVFLSLGIPWWHHFEDPLRRAGDGRGGQVFASVIAFAPAVPLYLACSALEVHYGEGPHVQLFCWPFVAVVISNSLRRGTTSHPTCLLRRGALLALPAALLAFPDWIMLVLLLFAGAAVLAEILSVLATGAVLAPATDPLPRGDSR